VSHSISATPVVVVKPPTMTQAKKTTTGLTDVSEKKKEYKYQQEISQMVRSQM
jgi:hypothetical protein